MRAYVPASCEGIGQLGVEKFGERRQLEGERKQRAK
jgi:hypothetical protein